MRRVEDGLVDFPALREGREVHLCWRSGEAKIDYWHEVDAGIAGPPASLAAARVILGVGAHYLVYVYADVEGRHAHEAEGAT